MPHLHVLWRLQVRLKLACKSGPIQCLAYPTGKLWSFFQQNFQCIIMIPIRANRNTQNGIVKKSFFHWTPYLNSFTHRTHWAQMLGFWVTDVVSKWCHYVMVEADSHPKLLPASILDIYKVFEHIDMLSIGIWYKPYTVIQPTRLRFWGSGSLMWSGNDVIISWLRLRLTAISNCFTHPYETYTKCLSILICCPLAHIVGYMVTWGV